VNPPENRAAGFPWWVEVEPGDAELGARLVVRDEEGVPHLRLVEGGRCVALRGTMGKRVRCAVYADRPSPCRRVQAGDELCMRYRAAQGIG
jgi:Fe-S-cluster containining protein